MSNWTGGDMAAALECQAVSVHPACMLGAASAVVTDCAVGVSSPLVVRYYCS